MLMPVHVLFPTSTPAQVTHVGEVQAPAKKLPCSGTVAPTHLLPSKQQCPMLCVPYRRPAVLPGHRILDQDLGPEQKTAHLE